MKEAPKIHYNGDNMRAEQIKKIDKDGELAYIGMRCIVAEHISLYPNHHIVKMIVDDFLEDSNNDDFWAFMEYINNITIWNGATFKEEFKEIWDTCIDLQDMCDLIAIIYNIDCYICNYDEYYEDDSQIICYHQINDYKPLDLIELHKECSRLATLLELESVTMNDVLDSVEYINKHSNNFLDTYDCTDEDPAVYAFNILERVSLTIGGAYV